ncbi:MAG: hypothetical protein ACXWC2_00300 [Ramlibacter sp.]
MPDPKDNAKLTGDTHQPDLDSADDQDAPSAEYRRSGTPGAAATQDAGRREGGAGKPDADDRST